MTFMFVCWCDRRFGECDAFERHAVDCKDAPPSMRRRREEGRHAGTASRRSRGLCRLPAFSRHCLLRPIAGVCGSHCYYLGYVVVFNLVNDDLCRNAEFFGKIVYFFAIYHPMRNPISQTVRRRKELRSERAVTFLPFGVASGNQSITIK